MSENVIIIGAGRMGLALGTALLHTDTVDRLTYYGRGMEPPPHPIFDDDNGASYETWPRALPDGTTVVLLAVPDSALAEVSYDLAAVGHAPRGCCAFHLSGALSTQVLAPLVAAGYEVGSFHPLQAVADPWIAGDRLIGASFAVAGERAAITAARRLADGLAGNVLVVPPAHRAVYHAGAVVASNYLIGLLSFAVRLFDQAGISEGDAVDALLPLVRGTLDNLEKLGVGAALTGPIARGDADTVRLHLTQLSGNDRTLYCALGLEVLQLARSRGLDRNRVEELESLLSLD